MKKMILSAVAVSLSSVAAHAATNTTVSNPEIYGNLGVSLDHYKLAGVDHKSAIDYTRNTKIGVRGDADVSGIHSTYEIEGKFKPQTNVFGLSKAEVNLGLGMTNVTLGKFDSRFGEVTGNMDAFGNTFNNTKFDHGANSVTGVAVSVSPIQDLTVGVQVNGQDQNRTFGKQASLFAKYSVNNLDLAAGYQLTSKIKGHVKGATGFAAVVPATDAKTPATDAKTPAKVAPVAQTLVGGVGKTQAFNLAAGYTIDNVYVDGYFSESKAKDAKANITTGVAAAYNVDENLIVKAGYDFNRDEMKVKTNTFRVAAQYNINDVELDLGFANAKSKGKKSDNLMTAGVVYKF